jgi:hypothetical protein
VKFAHIALGIAVSAGLVAALSPEAESVPDKVVLGRRPYCLSQRRTGGSGSALGMG